MPVSGTPDRVMYALGWKVDELSRLNKQARQLHVDISVVKDLLKDKSSGRKDINHLLSKLRDPLKVFLKAVSYHHRTPATHILVTMISPRDRSKKPYALPVCCLAYSSLNETAARAHISIVIQEMHKCGIKVEGLYVCLICVG